MIHVQAVFHGKFTKGHQIQLRSDGNGYGR